MSRPRLFERESVLAPLMLAPVALYMLPALAVVIIVLAGYMRRGRRS